MKTKKAFTMVELIAVIVVMGVLAAYSIPRYKRDTRVEAINHMLSMIRYTQNLALHDSMHSDTNSSWQQSFWRFHIAKCKNSSGLYYTIGTDKSYSGYPFELAETAIDPSNGKHLYWNGYTKCPKINNNSLIDNVSPNIFITQRYGIDKVVFSSCSVMESGSRSSVSRKHIGFDNFGRPMRKYTASDTPDYNGHTVTDCRIRFYFQDNSINPFTIVIPAESGYAYLQENKNL